MTFTSHRLKLIELLKNRVNEIRTRQPEDAFKIVKEDGQLLAIELSGSVENERGEMLQRLLRKYIANSHFKYISLDLSLGSYIDSGGVSALVTAYKDAQSTNKSIALISPSRQLECLLENLRLTSVLEIYSDYDQLAQFRPQYTMLAGQKVAKYRKYASREPQASWFQ